LIVAGQFVIAAETDPEIPCKPEVNTFTDPVTDCGPDVYEGPVIDVNVPLTPMIAGQFVIVAPTDPDTA
jgi:hypothetical protein